jgi:hypothetical protein
MPVHSNDRRLLRDLAKRVAEAAGLPLMQVRREMWKRHNRLERVRPMVLVFPEGSWRELLPESALACEGEEARGIERQLRMRLYHHEHLCDDTVIEKEWIVPKVVHDSGWGLEPRWKPSPDPTGARAFDPVINTPADLKKLAHPQITYDGAATERHLADAQDLFGDVLDVKLKGVCRVAFCFMSVYTSRRGLEQVMMDMAADPNWVHDAMAFLQEGYQGLVRQYVEQNLLGLNNDGSYHSSGGVGYTDELPAVGFDRDRVRPCDMWASAQEQELAQVSPEMHAEFCMTYERPLLAQFGLNGYGCCEDLTRKMDDVLALPHMRRISIAPFADVDVCAEKLGCATIFSWKPHPSHLVGEFNADRIRQYIQHTVDVTHDGIVEMILKDTHTCEHHPERFSEWTRIAREVAENA